MAEQLLNGVCVLEKQTKNGDSGPGERAVSAKSVLELDLASIERCLEETRQKASAEARENPPPPEPEPKTQAEITVAVMRENAVDAVPNAFTETSFLAALAREADEKLGVKKSVADEARAKARKLHDALNAIAKFFFAFNKHVNNLEPEVNRSYRLDARTTFGNLRWQGAQLDYRKLDLTEAAFLAHVTFSVSLCTPDTVIVKRPWEQLKALEKELNLLRLKSLDDLEEISKRPKQEWLEARLAPEFPVQIRFNGNYDQGCIDVLSRNLGIFGVAAYKLAADDVTPELMDALGLFLLGRSDKVPAALVRVEREAA